MPRKSKEAVPRPARAKSSWGCAFLAVLLVSGGLSTTAWTAAEEKGTGARRPNASTLEVGRVVFEQNCAICHGPLGNGRGMAGMMVRTKPRDFRPGIFKFRSTPTGSLPTDEDLFQTISQGLRGTGMIAQDDLPESKRWAVVEYLKTFSECFQQEKPQTPIPIPKPPPRTPELIGKGREVYHKAECFKCHGTKGRGDGPSATDLRDDWGYPIQAADLTRPSKRGSTPETIYRTILTGLDGTPMPSYEGALSDEEFWALSFYVASLNTGVLSTQQRREEAAGQHVLRMHGGRGPGMMRRMPMMQDMPMR
ncbi:MAG: c-type cytochrome [Candidatus Methylomirabilales bacterium]